MQMAKFVVNLRKPTCRVDVEATDTVADVKAKILAQYQLEYRGVVMDDDRLLSAYELPMCGILDMYKKETLEEELEAEKKKQALIEEKRLANKRKLWEDERAVEKLKQQKQTFQDMTEAELEALIE